ncbi:Major facilitator superfamily domain-containing protein 6-like isoform x1 protein [Gryllus bimaculatus]|nr:Major facilitator superfamily domain-containing protein 6-like isoform x1 protein [Gryllus bimaculatus]
MPAGQVRTFGGSGYRDRSDTTRCDDRGVMCRETFSNALRGCPRCLIVDSTGWQKGKTMLLASLGAWILFTLPLGFIQPPAVSCIQRANHSWVLAGTHVDNAIVEKRSVPPGGPPAELLLVPLPEELELELASSGGTATGTGTATSADGGGAGGVGGAGGLRRERRSLQLTAGQSPIGVGYASNYNEQQHASFVSPLFSSMVYRTQDIEKAFFLLLLLVIIGEFFSAPAITLADSAVITLLGEDADRYGHQRMFGSLGWGLAMFFVGIALDHSTAFPGHPCGPDAHEKNYTICFATFSVLMGAALITATQTKMFAQTTREMPEWVTVMKQFANLKCGSFLFVAWFMGFGIGLIFTFLFWHLQDYGGSPTLFGVASVINHISEIFAYFFSFRLIRQMGHVKVLCLGLVGNVLRFLYISYLRNPWWVLPFEFMQGTTATFRGYGVCCLLVLGAFVFINFYRRDTGFVSELPAAEDPHQVAEETAHLAPHGSSAGPCGGTTNPFLQNGGGGGGGYNYRAAEPVSDEAIRRNFQRYNEVLSEYEGSASKAGGPPALTRLQAQQPVPSTAHAAYDW